MYWMYSQDLMHTFITFFKNLLLQILTIHPIQIFDLYSIHSLHPYGMFECKDQIEDLYGMSLTFQTS